MRSLSTTSPILINVNKILPLRELTWVSVHLVREPVFQHRLVDAIYHLRQHIGMIWAIAQSREFFGEQYRTGFALF